MRLRRGIRERPVGQRVIAVERSLRRLLSEADDVDQAHEEGCNPNNSDVLFNLEACSRHVVRAGPFLSVNDRGDHAQRCCRNSGDIAEPKLAERNQDGRDGQCRRTGPGEPSW